MGIGNLAKMTFVHPFTVLVVLGIALCGVLVLFFRLIKRENSDWRELVGRLQRVNYAPVALVANDFLHPFAYQITMEPEEMWKFVGGYDGLKKMRHNAEIMLVLAAYCQRWNADETVVVRERMRREAVKLRRAVLAVELGMLHGRIFARFRRTIPFNVQEAASSYYLMRERLLALYESSHSGLYPALAAAL